MVESFPAEGNEKSTNLVFGTDSSKCEWVSLGESDCGFDASKKIRSTTLRLRNKTGHYSLGEYSESNIIQNWSIKLSREKKKIGEKNGKVL